MDKIPSKLFLDPGIYFTEEGVMCNTINAFQHVWGSTSALTDIKSYRNKEIKKIEGGYLISWKALKERVKQLKERSTRHERNLYVVTQVLEEYEDIKKGEN